MFILNGAILRRIAPNLTAVRAAKIAKLLNEICPTYGIRSARAMHHFLANVLHECAAFTSYSESLNYSVEGLLATFGRHRITEAQARQLGRIQGRAANQEAIANIVYGGAFGRRELGNEQPGDGWAFRGAGAIHTTGRRNFTILLNYLRNNYGYPGSLSNLSSDLRNDDRWAIHGACYFFAVQRRLVPVAEAGDFMRVVRVVNGGVNGLEDRRKYFALCEQNIFDQQQTNSVTTLSRLNLRSGPGTNFPSLLVLEAGTRLPVIGRNNGWVNVQHNSQTGWVSEKFTTQA